MINGILHNAEINTGYSGSPEQLISTYNTTAGASRLPYFDAFNFQL